MHSSISENSSLPLLTPSGENGDWAYNADAMQKEGDDWNRLELEQNLGYPYLGDGQYNNYTDAGYSGSSSPSQFSILARGSPTIASSGSVSSPRPSPRPTHHTTTSNKPQRPSPPSSNRKSSRPTPSPTRSSSGSNPAGTNESNVSNLGIFIAFLVAIIGLFVMWQCFLSWRRKRAQNLQYRRSAQAERALGDMQMIPNDDFDNELL